MEPVDFAGKYTLIRRIAAGGMAEVFLARQAGIDGFEKHVVIKRILPQFAKQGHFVRMFLDEARVAADLRHSNVVHVYEIGESEGDYFIAMEYLHGQTLRGVRRAVRDRDGSFPLVHALRIIREAAQGLDYAHRKEDLRGNPLGIVHRDVSPSNLLITYEGTTKLVDFGIAKAKHTRDTDPGQVKGKLSYMAPEQARNEELTPAADQFALGIILYELTTGARLFSGSSDADVLRSLLECKIPPPSLVLPNYPKGLERIVMRTLALEPAHRFADCGALSEALDEFASHQGIRSNASRVGAWMRGLFRDDLRAEAVDTEERDAALPKTGETRVDRESGAAVSPAAAAVKEAPTGDVALVFTDIENSTPLWERQRGPMQLAMVLHDHIVREHLADAGGYEVQNRGDAFKLAFHSTVDAVKWCIDVQRALLLSKWPDELLSELEASEVRQEDGSLLFRGLRVRMGVHFARPDWGLDHTTQRVDYTGPEVNRGSRVASAAHGGQILISGSAWDAIQTELDGTLESPAVEELGEHQLRGIEAAERLVQILPRELEGRIFPPPRVEHAPRTNLPPELTAFVGRTTDLDTLSELVGRERLVTLFGPGGIGKTRLARRYGRFVLENTERSVWLCDLADAKTIGGICLVVGTAIGVPLVSEKTNAATIEMLGHAIAARGETLIMLDNFEQIAEFAQDTIGRWMTLAPQASFLVTSRNLLKLEGEASLELGPLSLPETAADVEGSEAVQLFVQRARAVRPDYKLSSDEAPVLGEIVKSLDGLPLAIELAAARMNIFTPEKLLERLSERFKLLAGGKRTDAARQHSLRKAIDWSWDLLESAEQSALAQCAVFRGGFSMEAAEAVIDLSAFPDAPWVVDLLQSLREKSLLQTEQPKAFPAETRFTLYESIREYAEEKQDEVGSRAETERRHRIYFLELCDSGAGLGRVGLEVENIVAVLRRAAASRPQTEETASASLRAAIALGPIFAIKGPFAAYLMLLDEALEHEETVGVPMALRARVLYERANALLTQGDLDAAQASLDQAFLLLPEHEARLAGRLKALQGSVQSAGGHYVEAERTFEAALTLQADGDDFLRAWTLSSYGRLHHDTGKFGVAKKLYDDSFEIYHRIGQRRFEGVTLSRLARLHQDSAKYVEAKTYHRRALAIHLDVGNRRAEGLVIGALAALYHEEERFEEAQTYYQMALAILREVGDRRKVAELLLYRAIFSMERDRWLDARADLDMAVAIFSDAGAHHFQALALAVLGGFHRLEGADREANVAFGRAAELLSGNAFVAAHLLSACRGELESAQKASPRSDIVRLAVRLMRRENPAT